MNLKEMKAIAEKRTKGKWKPVFHYDNTAMFAYSSGPFHIVKDLPWRDLDEENPEDKKLLDQYPPLKLQAKKDAEFIAMCANNFDKMIAVVEAAKKATRATDRLMGLECWLPYCDLKMALKKLENDEP